MPILSYRVRVRTFWVKRILQPSTRTRTLCHGCGQPFRPAFRNNVRCPKCMVMARVIQHQTYKRRGAQGFERHTCADCRWALRRGLQMERE